MSFVKGSKREQKEFGKIVGMFEAKVIGINPTKEELEVIYGPQDKEPEYVKEKEIKLNEEGDTAMVVQSRVDVYLKDVKGGSILKAVFYLEDRVKENKDKTKKQYINSGGTTSWATKESELKDWFTKRDYRVAKVGEDEFYGFLKSWLNIDFSKEDSSFDLNEFKNFIEGDFKAIKGEIGGDNVQTIVALATVRTVEKDGETNDYQGVYNRMFLPGYNIKFFRTKKFTPEIIQEIEEKQAKGEKLKLYEKFVLQVTDTEYGVQDFYKLEEAAPYDPAENVATGDAVLTGDPESSDY